MSGEARGLRDSSSLALFRHELVRIIREMQLTSECGRRLTLLVAPAEADQLTASLCLARCMRSLTSPSKSFLRLRAHLEDAWLSLERTQIIW